MIYALGEILGLFFVGFKGQGGARLTYRGVVKQGAEITPEITHIKRKGFFPDAFNTTPNYDKAKINFQALKKGCRTSRTAGGLVAGERLVAHKAADKAAFRAAAFAAIV